jgi:hypothetical protein
VETYLSAIVDHYRASPPPPPSSYRRRKVELSIAAEAVR